MNTKPTTLAHAPLTEADLEQLNDPDIHRALQDRLWAAVLDHLGDGWTTYRGPRDFIDLLGPHNERIMAGLYPNDGWQLHLTAYDPDPHGPLFSNKRLPVTTPPAEIAAFITGEILPDLRIATARWQERRTEHVARTMALHARLGDRWWVDLDLTAGCTHLNYSANVQGADARSGEITVHPDGGVSFNLTHVKGPLAERIINALNPTGKETEQ